MAAFSGGDAVGAIVADVGQYATKVGFAGEDYPRSYFRSVRHDLHEQIHFSECCHSHLVPPQNVAILREDAPNEKDDNRSNIRRIIRKTHYDFYTRPICNGEHDGNWEVANAVNKTTGLWYDPESVEGGADWNDLLQIFLRHGYDSALMTQLEDHPLLLVERSYNPPPIRQQVLECLFEDLHVPAAFLGRDATLACYACGRGTGTVVDIGYGSTVVTPVFEGYVEQKGIRRSPIGGLAMDELVLNHLDQLTQRPFMPLYQIRRPGHAKRMEPIHRLARLDIAQHCKESGAGAQVAPTANNSSFTAAPQTTFELPDGQTVTIPPHKRFAVADLLLGQDDESVQRREEAVVALQKEFTSIVNAATQTDDDAVGSGMNETNDASSSFNAATAVGISPRRTKRGAAAAAAAAKATADASKKPPFSNRHLQKACGSYLQSCLEQITASPVAAMVCDAAFRCDRDQQASLLGNCVLAGGGACLGPSDQALPDLLREQIEAIIHTHTPGWRVKVLSPSVQERSICSWLGGSILASMGTFHDMWITRAEYEEWGTAIVNRKCP
jgi:actin-related protein